MPKTAEMLTSRMLEIYKMFYADPINGSIVRDFVRMFTNHADAFLFVYKTFLPFALQCITTKEAGGALTDVNKGTQTDFDFLSVTISIQN